ncbi:phage terminase, large subunit, PBSX family [Thermosyntropha lipolytica DSM 11003]|uniref:Phage terminase, large subunit, PBSX family n=1 Tax=Thermosyntropha lipolytica DSM 11003 TaxID=1123382 RepID=A0A1M5RBV1_9FIRM|nr:PBSX family phage terminase large subunit [Thermosyntropha lipolytica]SHH23824.1 phage terminase, large subunit, PBSX family [Thermosyntropha lipolytica DSM 11003]
MEIVNSLSEKQLGSILQADRRINIWSGAVRSGKTVASLVRWLEFLAAGPPGPVMMVGKTERSLKRNILDLLAEWLPGAVTVNLGRGEAWILGRQCYLASANDERAEAKLRGITLAGAYGDEVSTWPESFFRQLLARLSLPGAMFFGTTNPDGPRHWLKREFLDRADELDLAVFDFSLFDNPFLPVSYVDALKAEYTGVWYRRFVLGEWCAAEGMVYDCFDEKRHVVGEFPVTGEAVIGVDYGASNPACFVLVIASSRSGPFYVAREFYHDPARTLRQKTDEELAADLECFAAMSPVPVKHVFVDPSAVSFIQACRRRRLPVARANNKVLPGIRLLHNLLAQEKVLIHKDCRALIDDIYSYSWDSRAQTHGEDKPVKSDAVSHAVDALRYAVASFYTPPAAGRTAQQELPWPLQDDAVATDYLSWR